MLETLPVTLIVGTVLGFLSGLGIGGGIDPVGDHPQVLHPEPGSRLFAGGAALGVLPVVELMRGPRVHDQ